MGSTSHTDVQDRPRTWNCDDWRKWFKRLSCYKSRHFFLFHNLKWLNAIIFFIKHSIKPQNSHLNAKLIYNHIKARVEVLWRHLKWPQLCWWHDATGILLSKNCRHPLSSTSTALDRLNRCNYDWFFVFTRYLEP